MAASDSVPTDRILASIEHAEFVWDFATDAMTWGAGVAAMLPDFPSEAIASGAEFAKRIEPQRSVRSDAIARSHHLCCIRPRSRWDQATWRLPCW